jgi:23S rRNA (pseudouridine1915-N3)-methyltransferase
VGRLRAGPERLLVEDWLGRFERTGRAFGLGPCGVVEVETPGGSSPEGAALLARVPRDAWLCALDERGTEETSPDFARRLQRAALDHREAVFAIGGADGLDGAVRARANHLLSFGRMVWPHMLARAMLAEQLYRAATILAGSPYHRA